MRSRLFRIAFLFVLCLGTLLRADTITVSAAISLKDVLTDISHQYESDTGDKLDLNFGASGTLAAQIAQGAPVDLFISAANDQVDVLIKAGLVDSSTRRAIAANRLVLIVPKSAGNPPAKFQDLTDPRFHHIALGDVKVVPAGQYAMQTLQSLKIDKVVSDRLIMGENVRQVLAYVSRGEADAGIVYSTDAVEAADTVMVAAVADESTHDPIVYPAVILKTAKRAPTEKFLNYLSTDAAKSLLQKRGFTIPESATRPSTQP